MRIKCLTGAGTLADDKEVRVWRQQKTFYSDGTQQGTSSSLLLRFYEDGEVFEHWYWGPDGTVTTKTIQYEVGSLQHAGENNWTANAATPSF
jgi:hypothetical protein